MMDARCKTFWTVGLLVCCGLMITCGRSDEAAAPSPETVRPNVVLIVVDTLRADRLPFYGCPRDTAPFLTRLAEQSLVFENAWSPSSWTLPATVSVLTSLHPFQHGVNRLDGLELGPEDEPVPVNAIPGEVETLAEVLAAAGYRTYGIASNILVGEEVGFERGFDRFVRLNDEPADVVNGQLALWKGELLAGEEPYFLYLHYFDPHDPFHARDPWFDLGLDLDLDIAGASAGWPEELSLWGEDFEADLDWMRTRLVPGPTDLGDKKVADLSAEELDQLIRWMRAAYDSEISFVDSKIEEAVDMLGLDDAIVVFLSDHGEEFYEHGDLTHGYSLYTEMVRVPFFVHLPGGDAPRGRVARHVSTLDVLPTLRALLGLPRAPRDQGQDLFADLDRSDVLGFLAPESSQASPAHTLRSLTTDRFRLIERSDGRVELYDVAGDPLERRDVASEHPEVVAEMLAELERRQSQAPTYEPAFRTPEAISPEMREHLEGLGYLGTGAESDAEP